MIKKLLTSLLMLVGFAMYAQAQQDTMYVVKEGKIVGTFEVGKDIDGITFKNPLTPSLEDFVKYGDTKVGLKSATAMSMYGMTYVYISPEEGISTDYKKITSGKTDYIMIVLPDVMVGDDIDLAEYSKDEEADEIQIYYINAKENKPYAGVSSYDFASEGFNAGSLKVEIVDDLISVEANLVNRDTKKNTQIAYSGKFGVPTIDDNNSFTVDGNTKKVNSAYYLAGDDLVDLYITSGDIDNARELNKCFYYAHIQVPVSALDGRTIDLTGKDKFLFEFVDNTTETTYTLTPGNVGSATGSISVKQTGEGTYKVVVNVESFGPEARNFSTSYNGEYDIYDISIPNAYGILDKESKALNSAVATLKDGLYTIYLSSKENVTTIEGMADADIVIEMPEVFMNDGTKGFSGTEDNAKVSITYNGKKYNQASCGSKKDNANAIGGNVKASIVDGNISIDFNIYSIYSLGNASMTGHFGGKVTIVE